MSGDPRPRPARLGELVDDVLDLTRSAAGRLDLELAPIDLAALCRGLVDETGERRSTSAQARARSSSIDPVVGRCRRRRAAAAPGGRPCAAQRGRATRPRAAASCSTSAATTSRRRWSCPTMATGMTRRRTARASSIPSTAPARAATAARARSGSACRWRAIYVEAHGGTIALEFGAGRGDHGDRPPAADAARERAACWRCPMPPRPKRSARALAPLAARRRRRRAVRRSRRGQDQPRARRARRAGPRRARRRARPSRSSSPMRRPRCALPVAHVDLYRLDAPEDAEELGLDEYARRRRAADRMARTARRAAVARCAPPDARTRRRRRAPLDLGRAGGMGGAMARRTRDDPARRTRPPSSPRMAGAGATILPLAGDASFRRYFRVVDRRPHRGADGRAARSMRMSARSSRSPRISAAHRPVRAGMPCRGSRRRAAAARGFRRSRWSARCCAAARAARRAIYRDAIDAARARSPSSRCPPVCPPMTRR